MAEAFYGWMGQGLRVDLSTGRWERFPLSPALLAECLGGRGLAGHFLAPHATLAWDDPGMPLVFAVGPLAGTGAPGSGLCHVASRSPLTGAVGDGALLGGLGVQLKRAGIDVLVVAGRSQTPVGIALDGENVRLEDAAPLLALSTPDAFARLRARHAHGSIALTGAAAEHGCRFATIQSDLYHQAGRCGLGLCAGRKNLKHLVVRGARDIPVADPAGLARAREDILRLLNASPALMGQQGYTRYGTQSLFDLMDARRMMPTENFRRTHFPPASGLGPAAWSTRHHPRPLPCMDCPVGCVRLSGDGRPMPEFDAMSHFTALLGCADMELAMRAVDFCACLGLDPVSAAAALACHFEAGGQTPEPERVLALLLGMGANQGPEASLGQRLAQGAARHAAEIGRPELAMCVKGQELPAVDPRGAWGMALAYAVASHGGSSARAWPVSHEVLRKPVATDRLSFLGKARAVKLAEDAAAAADSLMVCKRLLLAAGMEEFAKAHTAVTGQGVSGGDLLLAGARVEYRERLLNARIGFSAKDDDLPARFFSEPGSADADIPAPALDREGFLAARAAYYRIRGLSPDGRPLPEEAERLGLAWPEGLTRPAVAPDSGAAFCSVASDFATDITTGGHGGLAEKYAAKLSDAGLCAPGEPLVAALDDGLCLSRADDSRAAVAEEAVRGLGAAALLLARPVGACGLAVLELARQAVESGAGLVVPGDCETRTFLHDLPVVSGLSVEGLCAALSHRKGCLVLDGDGVSFAAAGSVSPEQAFVTASSMGFACFVAYFAAHLRDLRLGGMTDARRARFAEIRAVLLDEAARQPQSPPDLAAGPFATAETARAAMIEAGRHVVGYGLVDSAFGNLSCRQMTPEGELLLISQTGSSLDELGGCVDPCRFDGASCVGLTASSELTAHRAVYDGGPARVILHGHPRFSVILSMDCERLDCPSLGQCHRSCSEPRSLRDDAAELFVPIVPGEVGTGPFGLCNTLPPALTDDGGRAGAIVYGHGLFATGRQDFREAFATLLSVERYAMAEYFRRVDALDPA